MKYLFALVTLALPLLSHAQFKQRNYQCFWNIGNGWGNNEVGILDVSYLTIVKKGTQKSLAFQFFSDDGNSDSITLTYTGEVRDGFRFVVPPAAYSNITRSIKLFAVTIPKPFLGEDAVKALGGQVEFFSKEGPEILAGSGGCNLLKQL